MPKSGIVANVRLDRKRQRNGTHILDKRLSRDHTMLQQIHSSSLKPKPSACAGSPLFTRRVRLRFTRLPESTRGST
jgi:hypothetical protein